MDFLDNPYHTPLYGFDNHKEDLPMNQDRFGQELSRLITGYIDSRMDVDENFRVEKERVKQSRLIAMLEADMRSAAVQEILGSELFQLTKKEILENIGNEAFIDCLYLNISNLYEELNILADYECEDE